MALFDRFKKSKTQAAPPKEERPVEEAGLKPAVSATPKGERRVLGMVLVPHVTEKTTGAQAHGWYAFRVPMMAGKIGVKQAVEDRYRVHVDRVRMSLVRPRQVRLGRTIGRTPGFKKAMVKLAVGQSIEFS